MANYSSVIGRLTVQAFNLLSKDELKQLTDIISTTLLGHTEECENIDVLSLDEDTNNVLDFAYTASGRNSFAKECNEMIQTMQTAIANTPSLQNEKFKIETRYEEFEIGYALYQTATILKSFTGSITDDEYEIFEPKEINAENLIDDGFMDSDDAYDDSSNEYHGLKDLLLDFAAESDHDSVAKTVSNMDDNELTEFVKSYQDIYNASNESPYIFNKATELFENTVVYDNVKALLLNNIIPGWEKLVQSYGVSELKRQINEAYADNSKTIYPEKRDVFNAYINTKPEDVKIVILGQDPYVGPNQAHGLAFSIKNKHGRFAPSLMNIFKELESEYGALRTNTNLSDWSKQGVFLLNTLLTVEAGIPLSHSHIDWQKFTLATIQYLESLSQNIVYILLGNHAKSYAKYITNGIVLTTSHPSPLGAHRGFLGSNIFKRANDELEKQNKAKIEWVNEVAV